MSRLLLHSILGVLLALGSAVATAEAAGGAEAESPLETDPVVADVLHMLEEGVGSEVVLDWLVRQHERVLPLSPDDVIRLTRAGASDELVQKLLDMSNRTPGPPPLPPPVTAARPYDPPDGLSKVVFALRYRSNSDHENFDQRWALFAYLDGELLTWSSSQSTFSRKTVGTSKLLSPGKHVIRLLRESHKRRGKKGWRHEAHVCPDTIEFEVEPEAGWKMSVDWVEPTFAFRGKGPLSWQLSRWDERVAGVDHTGARKGDWPQLCEDMEANTPEGKKPPGWVRRGLKGCVRWSSLWEGVEALPTRDDIRAELEQDKFRPPRIPETASPTPGAQ